MTVKFSVKNKMLFNYLSHVFSKESCGSFRVTMKNDFGRLVVALVRRSSKPIESDVAEFTATLLLPKNTLTNNAECCHLYITNQDTARLNVFLDSIFNIDLNAFFQKGCKQQISQRDIIEAFVVSRKLFDEDFAETLGKRVYRNQLRDLHELTTSLYRKARYNNERIEGPEAP